MQVTSLKTLHTAIYPVSNACGLGNLLHYKKSTSQQKITLVDFPYTPGRANKYVT